MRDRGAYGCAVLRAYVGRQVRDRGAYGCAVLRAYVGRQVRDRGAYGCAVLRAYVNLNPGLDSGQTRCPQVVLDTSCKLVIGFRRQ